jgi:hypothetical protein
MTWGTIVVKSNFFIHFLGELKMPIRHFEINWPLIHIKTRNILLSFCLSMYCWFQISMSLNLEDLNMYPEIRKVYKNENNSSETISTQYVLALQKQRSFSPLSSNFSRYTKVNIFYKRLASKMSIFLLCSTQKLSLRIWPEESNWSLAKST